MCVFVNYRTVIPNMMHPLHLMLKRDCMMNLIMNRMTTKMILKSLHVPHLVLLPMRLALTVAMLRYVAHNCQ